MDVPVEYVISIGIVQQQEDRPKQGASRARHAHDEWSVPSAASDELVQWRQIVGVCVTLPDALRR